MENRPSNLKRIKIEDLKPGMFIVRMDRSWFKHPFLGNKKLITSEKQISRLRDYGILEVYIDPERGLDVSRGDKDSGPGLDPGRFRPEKETGRSPGVTPPADVPAETTVPPRSDTKPPGTGEKTSGQESGFPLSPPAETPRAPFSVLTPGDALPAPAEIRKRPVSAPDAGETGPFSRDIDKARAVQKEARALIRDVMQDIRLGKSFESDRVKRVVNSIMESIFTNDAALLSLTRVKEYDEYTYVHSIDVCILSLTLGRHLNLPRDELERLGIGALLHDVGKTRIPYSILYKPGKLSEEEWGEIRKHPLYGLQILENARGIPEEAKEVAAKHHERFNGQGYPYGIAGEDIGIHSQIAGIIDVYDALTRDQMHKEGVLPHEAIKIIYDRCRSDFDSLLVERFIQCIGIYPIGTPVLLDSEEIGLVAGINQESLLRPKVLVVFKDSLKKYPEPFFVDLTEKRDSTWFKRTIVMPLNPGQWRLHLEDYLSWMPNNSR